MWRARAAVNEARESISRAFLLRLRPLLTTAAVMVPMNAIAGEATTAAAGTYTNRVLIELAQVVTGKPGGWVCFYRGKGYTGAKWCVTSGTRVETITRDGWDNTISSIRVSPGGAIHVCRRPGLKGECTIYSRSRWHLYDFDNAISSFVVLGGDGGLGPGTL